MMDAMTVLGDWQWMVFVGFFSVRSVHVEWALDGCGSSIVDCNVVEPDWY